MISVKEAQEIVLKSAKILPVESAALTDAYGRVLRENIRSDRDQPPFDKSTMDGIAVSFEALQKGVHAFVIEGITPAGQRQLKKTKVDGCFRIMTGAVVPQGCDCVIPVEYVRLQGNRAAVSLEEPVVRGQNIRPKGSDHAKGALLLTSGCRLSPVHIAAAASVGKSKIKVSIKPKVAVIATGDELVDIDLPKIQPYQIRKSNSYALDATFKQTGLCEPQMFHLKDEPKLLLKEIGKILSKFDVVVLSGGVSMGEFDYVPRVLNELGVRLLFHKVAQKPGKPFWFGKSKTGQAVFALPGNPVSTQICAYRYVVPFLTKAAGLPNAQRHVALEEDIRIKSELAHFVPVRIKEDGKGMTLAAQVSTGGSGDYASLALADGFVELEASGQSFLKGALVPFFTW